MGATDLAFERATLQSAVALRIVTTQPYDQPRRNVSEVTLRLSAQAMWVWRFTRLSISVGAGVDCNRAVVPSRWRRRFSRVLVLRLDSGRSSP